MKSKIFGVYIMGNDRPTLYVGMTNCLPRRIKEHKEGKGSDFVKKYQLKKLLHYEYCENALQAIIREKQLKNLSRREKLKAIKKNNPFFADLSAEIFEQCDYDAIPAKPE